jgi:hypothetical protein
MTDPRDTLRSLVDGYQASQALHVAATLGIADLLAAGPRSCDELAASSGARRGSLYRLLRALASVGVLWEADDRRFALTPVGECLRSDVPGSLAPRAIYVGRPDHWQAWGALLHSVRTGENAFRHVHGVSVWEHRAGHPHDGAVFDAAMAAATQGSTAALLDAYDFGRFTSVVDVGGGQGAFLAALLARHPTVRGVLFDQEHVVAAAQRILDEAGVTGRCRIMSGSFFDAVPVSGDAYVLKAILHDWDDHDASAILRACRQAIRDDAALLVIERDLGPANAGAEAKFSDLNMLVAPGGRERTRDEYEALLNGAGFRLAAVIAAGAGPHVLEARAARSSPNRRLARRSRDDRGGR